ncbi:MAG: hypothetical protein ACTSSE_18635 [Candidatus Thorarchaeota archaeon]
MPEEKADDDRPVIMSLSEAKKDRWLKRIKVCLFDNYQDLADGSYQGDIKEEVIKMIQKNFPLNEPIAEDEFGDAITQCVEQVMEYINKHTTGVHPQFVADFTGDFIGQTLTTIFRVKESDPPPGIRDDDFMYG